MFGNEQGNSAEGATPVEGSSAPLSMEALLGKKVTDATVIEGGAKPAGTYVFDLEGIDEGSYEIKKEEHPRVGETAMMVTIALKIVQVDPKGKYIDSKKRKVTNEAMQQHIGKVFKENVMFGNDGLPKEDGTINNSGMNKLVTILSKIIGEDKYKAMEANGASIEKLVSAAAGARFMADISHNEWEGNVSDQLDLFSDFEVVPT